MGRGGGGGAGKLMGMKQFLGIVLSLKSIVYFS